MGCKDIKKIKRGVFIDISMSNKAMDISDKAGRKTNLIPDLPLLSSEEQILEYLDNQNK